MHERFWKHRSLLSLSVLLLNELASAPPADGLPPEYVTSAEGQITLYVRAPKEAANCQVFRNNGDGGSITIEVYLGRCDTNFVVSGLTPDRTYQFQARGIDAIGIEGARGTVVTYVSAGVPDWQGVSPSIEKIGANKVRLFWRPPANGGSPILGYMVDMESAGDGQWDRVYDGTNAPSVLTYFAEGLHASLRYNFRVYAENRVGVSAYAAVSFRISDLMAAPGARTTTLDPALSSDTQYSILIRSVEPTTQLDELVGGRHFVLSVHPLTGQMGVTGCLTLCAMLESTLY